MKQENKELLLKELCSRLPYNVKCKVHLDTKGYCLRDEDKYCDDTLESVNCEKQTCTFNKSIGYNFGYFAIEEVKPYLRPMSSMTKEEKEEIAFIRDRDFQSVRKWIHDESIKETGNICPITCGEIDYCNKKHLDYRGLIEKGLAIAVTKENNPYKL